MQGAFYCQAALNLHLFSRRGFCFRSRFVDECSLLKTVVQNYTPILFQIAIRIIVIGVHGRHIYYRKL